MILELHEKGCKIYAEISNKSKLNDFKFYCINGLWGGTCRNGEILCSKKLHTFHLLNVEEFESYINEYYHDDWIREIFSELYRNNEQPSDDEIEQMILDAKEEKRFDIIQNIGTQGWYKLLETEDQEDDVGSLQPRVCDVLKELCKTDIALNHYIQLLNLRNFHNDIIQKRRGYC